MGGFTCAPLNAAAGLLARHCDERHRRLGPRSPRFHRWRSPPATGPLPRSLSFPPPLSLPSVEFALRAHSGLAQSLRDPPGAGNSGSLLVRYFSRTTSRERTGTVVHAELYGRPVLVVAWQSTLASNMEPWRRCTSSWQARCEARRVMPCGQWTMAFRPGSAARYTFLPACQLLAGYKCVVAA